MARKKRKGHGGGHGSSERWLLTYADMITLLMAFFIMMYSMSILNLEKFDEMAFSIRSGFGGQLDGGGDSILNPSPGVNVKPTVLPELDTFPKARIAAQMRKYIRQHELDQELTLQETEQGLVLTIATDRVIFPKGRADISPTAEELLQKVASLVQKTASEIRVEGHTDNLPIHTEQFPSNWELSTARATRVVRYFIEDLGFRQQRLSAAGYADVRPLAPNDSEANRARNRRVQIVILRNASFSADAGAKPASKNGKGNKRAARTVADGGHGKHAGEMASAPDAAPHGGPDAPSRGAPEPAHGNVEATHGGADAGH